MNYYMNPEVIDYYVCLNVCVCALNKAKKIAYQYARTVQMGHVYGTALVRYGRYKGWTEVSFLGFRSS